ncbi:outer membrane beta-barrel protein [uncultured Algibacter sp.]|uniref:outer membrane beta-barrel protein n=1 Tax=uncultured Algibacter sp. TaxID=298659 RepID=UPI00321687A5
MKNLFLLSIIAVFAIGSVNAQDDSTGGFTGGDIYVSGSVGFNSTKTGDAKSNEFTFSPSVGYFISDNIALEASLLIGSSEDAGDNKTSSFGGGLGANYFFTPDSQFSFILGAGLVYVNSKLEPNGGGEAKTNTFAASVRPGLNYFVSDAFALRASIAALSYSSSKPDFSGADATNNFGLNVDFSDINFGVIYKF